MAIDPRVSGAASPVSSGSALVETKLTRPGLNSATLERRELADGVAREMWTSPLTLIVGPAGWGKTTLLALALAEAKRAGWAPRVAWVSIDAADDDPVRFWTHVIEALQRVEPALVPARAQLSPAGTDARELVPALTALLGALDQDIVLVLDDYHLITNRRIHEAFEALLEHPMERLHLVLASRSEPALPISRLRARGQAAEIRIDQLRFSDAEARALLTTLCGIAPHDAAYTELLERIEGWPAGIHLAALSLRGREDINQFFADFSGDDRYVLDYLTDEVLDRQPDDVRRFLIQTSVLGRLCASLCQRVTGMAEAREILLHLERAQLFVLPLDNKRVWFRYHPLFADALRRFLDEDPTTRHEIECRAAQWFIEHDLHEEAVDHLLSAGQFDEARDLIASAYWGLANRGQTSTVLSWLDRLPRDLVEADVRLLLARATASLFSGHQSDVVAALRLAAAAPELDGPLPDGLSSADVGVAMGWASLSILMGDVAEGRRWAETALERHGPRGGSQGANCEVLVASAALRGGDLERALELLQRSVQTAREADNVIVMVTALSGLSCVHARRMELPVAAACLREAESLLQGRISGDVFARRHLLYGRGLFLLRSGEPAEAVSVLEEARRLSSAAQDRISTVEVDVVLAEALLALGRRKAAADLLTDTRILLRQCADPGALLAADLERLDQRFGAPESSSPRVTLTRRQIDVLTAVEEGLTDSQIAVRLGVSERTVHAHLRDVYVRLGVRDRVSAVRAFRTNAGGRP